jgi:molecular chaperone HtpG
MAGNETGQTFGFQAEVRQLMHLMVHALYSNREIFLRELISNASDANDKLRFAALASPELAADASGLSIRVDLDPDSKSVSVSDDGIGMSRDEIIEQLGTIAHSGTARFIEQLGEDQKSDSRLIGQFGVGFYSAFIVAGEVEVVSRKAGLSPDEAVRWSSDGQGEFRVQQAHREQSGTTIRLRLKDDAGEFLDAARIRGIIRKYSDHVEFPVLLRAGPDAEPETVNQAKALWTRPRGEIKDDEYKAFYRHIAHDFSEPLAWSHNRVEGKREYTSLLYIPGTAPVDLWNREAPRGIKLYVQKVFITDHATNFLPLYLRFVRGVLDSSDLPLNVSREMLQHSPEVAAIRSALTRRVLDMMTKLAGEQPDSYRTLWREFGSVLKEGLAEDPANREKLAELLRFSSTRSGSGDAGRTLGAVRG